MPETSPTNRPQTGNPESKSFNHHRARRCDESGVDFSSCQLQNHFGNLALATNRDNRLTKHQADGEPRSPKIPAASINQPIFSLRRTNIVEILRKQKKSRCRNKEKVCRTPLLGLKSELLDILNCIFYIMWCPIQFFARLILTVVTWPTYVLYNLFESSMGKEETAIQKDESSRSTENKPKGHQASDLNERTTKPHYNFDIPGEFPASLQQKQENDKTSVVRTEDAESPKESQSRRKKSIPPLRLEDESLRESEKYCQYSSRHQDVSSVELSSDCLSDEQSTRFLGSKDRRKRMTQQFQGSLSVSTPKHPFSRYSGAVVDSKLKIKMTNPSRKNKLRIENQELSGAIKFSAENAKTINLSDATDTQIIALKKQLINCYSSMARGEQKLDSCRKSSAIALPINSKKKITDNSRPLAIPRLPLKPTSQTKSVSGDGRKCEDIVEKLDCALGNAFKSSTTASEVQNAGVQPILLPNHRATKNSGSCLTTDIDLSQEIKDVVFIGPNENNSQQLFSERDTEFSVSTTFESRYLKEVSELIGAERREEPKKQSEIKDSSSLEEAVKDVQQCEEILKNLEEEKIRIGSGDRLNTCKNGVFRIAEFTNPIDAKSKWLEMKKRFYGKDYAIRIKKQFDKLEPQNLSQIASLSKLPAHKIFQYNMRVARARQISAEPPEPMDILSENKTTSPRLTTLEDGMRWSNSTRNLVTPIPRCLSQTRSLSQWPDLSPSLRTRKYSLMEEKPRPKPRIKSGPLSPDRILANINAPQMDHLTSTRAHASVSSADVRTTSQNHSGNNENRMGSKSPRFAQRTIEKLVHLSDEEVEDAGFGNRLVPLSIHQVSQSRSTLDWPSVEKNTADVNLSDRYAGKIDSLISFQG